jgi:hypothetical protein
MADDEMDKNLMEEGMDNYYYDYDHTVMRAVH